MINRLGVRTPKNPSDSDVHAHTSSAAGSMTKRLAGTTTWRARLAGVLAILAMSVVVSTTGTAAAAQPAWASSSQPSINGLYNWIRNNSTGGCLQPEGMSREPGARVVLQECTTIAPQSIAQAWGYQKVGTNRYKFVNQYSSLCLDSSQAVNRGDVVQWPCANISNQEYKTDSPLPAITRIESRIGWRNSGYCVDAASVVEVWMWSCSNWQSQVWQVGF